MNGFSCLPDARVAEEVRTSRNEDILIPGSYQPRALRVDRITHLKKETCP